jgi:hypothetical protein
MTDFSQNKSVVKALVGGVVAGALHKTINKDIDWTQSGAFALVTSAGIFGSTLIENNYPNFQGDGVSQFSLKFATDVALTSGALYGSTKLMPSTLPDFSFSSIGIIMVSDLVGEATSRWMAGDINLFYSDSETTV